MDRETFETNVNSIKEMILDEQRLITYGSLSKDLCIHVNDSKKLLVNFVENLRKEQPDVGLNVNYIISGLSEDNKARTTVCSDKDIGSLRDSFKIIFFEHIYSVSKGVASVDNVALLAVSKLEDLSLCTGLIKSTVCEKRSADEIGSLKSSSQVTVQTEKKPHPPSKKVKEENKKDEDPKLIIKVHETKSEPIIKSELSPKKDLSSTKAKVDNKKNGVKTQKGIAGFFGKSNSAPSKMLSKNPTEDKQVTIKKEKYSPKDLHKNNVEKMDIDNKVNTVKKEKDLSKDSLKNTAEKMDIDNKVNTPIKEIKEKESKPEVKNVKSNGKQKTKANDKLIQIKKNAKVDKKRKRVLHVSDSESDDEKDPFVDDESELQENNVSDDEIPPTPTVNTVKITSGMVNPRKRRKIIDKTYTDEDGYILTKKEEVYESCSDNEEEVSVKENINVPTSNQIKQETSPNNKKNGLKNSKKKISPPQKGKQSTMMNFFKKV